MNEYLNLMLLKLFRETQNTNQILILTVDCTI
jgi:hypothetical protein